MMKKSGKIRILIVKLISKNSLNWKTENFEIRKMRRKNREEKEVHKKSR